MQKLETTSTDHKIIEYLREFKTENMQEDKQMKSLHEDIKYLSKKTNEQEPYSSKNCLIISNLPFLTGFSYSADVILFLKIYLGIIVNEWDRQPCHPLSNVYNEMKQPAVIVRFLTFNVKYRYLGRKYKLKDKPIQKLFLDNSTRNT